MLTYPIPYVPTKQDAAAVRQELTATVTIAAAATPSPTRSRARSG